LRRAVRYYFSFLGIQEPLLHRLVPIVAERFDGVFPEVKAQQDFIATVIKSEEEAFLRTLSNGLRRLEEVLQPNSILDGRVAFELYDTYGFPLDLTNLIANEKKATVDTTGFEAALNEQKERSRKDA
jgi:alanyl-tRNA synthetase